MKALSCVSTAVLLCLVLAAPAAADELSLSASSVFPGEAVSYTIKVEKHKGTKAGDMAWVFLRAQKECGSFEEAREHRLIEVAYSKSTTETQTLEATLYKSLGTYSVCEYYYNTENELDPALQIAKTFEVVAPGPGPTPFATASANCSTGRITFPAQSSAHPDVLVQFQSTGSEGFVEGASLLTAGFGVGDTGWVPTYSVEAGEAPSVRIFCSSGSVSASLAERPTTPATFSGITTPREQVHDEDGVASYLPFTTPGAGQYVLDAIISQGAITVEGIPGSIESSGQYSLGNLSAGDQNLRVEAENGPQAQWELTVKELPVTINGLSFGQAYMAPGAGLPADFSVTGDTQITATVTNSAGQPVRNLGTFPVSEGNSSISWDGRGNGGEVLPDGPYTLTLISNDPSGNTTSAQTTITLDSTPPSAGMISPASIAPSQSVAFQVTDAGSGVASFSVSIDGQVARTYGGFGNPLPPNGQVSFYKSEGWTTGTHHWEIVAKDNVNNQSITTGTFTVVAPKVKVATVATPKVKVVSHKVRRNTVTLVVQTPSAGTVRVSGSGLAAVKTKVKRAEKVTLKVKLSKAGLIALRRHHNKLTVQLRVSFEPSKGSSSSATVPVTFR